MADGKNCPECKADIGVWAVFSAGMPMWIRCPHCQAKLQYRDTVGIIIALGVIMLGTFATAFLAPVPEWLPDPAMERYFRVGVLIGVWVLIELVFTWFLRNHRELMSIKSASAP